MQNVKLYFGKCENMLIFILSIQTFSFFCHFDQLVQLQLSANENNIFIYNLGEVLPLLPRMKQNDDFS